MSCPRTLQDSRNFVSIALVRRVSRHEPRNNETQTAWRNMRRDRVMGHIFLLSFTLSKSTLVLRFFSNSKKNMVKRHLDENITFKAFLRLRYILITEFCNKSKFLSTNRRFVDIIFFFGKNYQSKIWFVIITCM